MGRSRKRQDRATSRQACSGRHDPWRAGRAALAVAEQENSQGGLGCDQVDADGCREGQRGECTEAPS